MSSSSPPRAHDPGGRPAELSVVIPTYNERDRLAELVARLFAATDAARIALELVVVDDNSPDGTGQIADELAKNYRLRVVHRAGKLGLGTAVVAGFNVASADLVGVMDADFSHPPELLPVLFRAFHETGADVAVASRYIPGGSTPNWPVKRKIMSRFACLLARPLSPIRDAASGFFLIRHSIAKQVTIKAGGFKICLELIVRGWPRKLVELPYTFEDRELGESKMSTREAAGYLFQLKDLMLLRWSKLGRPKREYRQLTVQDVERLRKQG
ncbi:MAG TPA: polyprenol monophosphomannose synthase [Vicinamibacterales bacterium]|nr:polyprenol monophosphomannose synthase [Vicinamibacterales bacterium]